MNKKYYLFQNVLMSSWARTGCRATLSMSKTTEDGHLWSGPVNTGVFQASLFNIFFSLPDEKRTSTVFIFIYLCKKIAYRIRFFLAFYHTFIAWNRKYKINFFTSVTNIAPLN
jgi:hypothetical protein